MPPKPQQQKAYIGIDPGLGGGIAIIWLNRVECWSMPPTESDIFHRIYHLKSPTLPAVARLEFIQTSIFGVGKSSMSKLYGNYCQLRMALLASGTRFETVRPVVWQRALKIPGRKKTESTTKWKNRLKSKAQELFPNVTVTLKTCDALLIADYCRRDELGLLK